MAAVCRVSVAMCSGGGGGAVSARCPITQHSPAISPTLIQAALRAREEEEGEGDGSTMAAGTHTEPHCLSIMAESAWSGLR